MDKDINHCVPILQQAWIDLRTWYAEMFPNLETVIGETQRLPTRSLMLFCQGRLPIEKVRALLDDDTLEDIIVSGKDGFNKISKHNVMPLSHAMDIWVKVNGKIVWDKKYYLPFGKFVQSKYKGILRAGVEWGDGPHIETI